MAVTLMDKEVSLKFVFASDEDENKKEYRTLSKINPEITNEDLMTIGQELSDLQSKTMLSMARVDAGTLTNEPD